MAIIIAFNTGKVIPPVSQRTATTRGDSAEEDQRKGLLAKIHIALASLQARAKTQPQLTGFSEDVYRFYLRDNYGKESAADLTLQQLEEVRKWLTSLGWRAKKGRHRKSAPQTLTGDSTPMNRQGRMEKIEAMLAEKGRDEGTDIPWGYAVSILKRQTANSPTGQVKSFDNASPAQLDDVIAALYRDAKRKGRKLR